MGKLVATFSFKIIQLIFFSNGSGAESEGQELLIGVMQGMYFFSYE